MIFRSVFLLLSMAIWSWWIIQPCLSSRQRAASFLGFMWMMMSLLALSSLLVKLGLIRFVLTESTLYAVPLDWVFALSITFGALLPLTRLWGWGNLLRIVLQLCFLSVVLVLPGVSISATVQVWIVCAVCLVCAIPAMKLSDWTYTETKVALRTVLQSVVWVILLFWFFPSIVFIFTAGDWSYVLSADISSLTWRMLPLLLPAAILVNALYHFAVQGGGTAFPYDPPSRLVTKGIYAYISNPMQVGITLAMTWWGYVINSAWITLSALVAIILFIVFKDVCNGSCAIGLKNPQWDDYQRNVPKWWPRFTRYKYDGK